MDLTRFTFHGTPISEDEAMSALIQKYEDKVEKYRKDIVAYVKEPCFSFYNKESQLGNLFADSFKNSTNADFSVINPGAIRIAWSAGNLTMYRIFRTIPFANKVVTIKVTGKELKKILEVIQAGQYGFYPFSGLKIEVELKPKRRLISVKLENGTELEEGKEYLIAGPDFFFNGGDDFAEVLKFYKPRDMKYFMTMRESLTTMARNLKVINSELHPLVNFANPRLIVKGGGEPGDDQQTLELNKNFLPLDQIEF